MTQAQAQSKVANQTGDLKGLLATNPLQSQPLTTSLTKEQISQYCEWLRAVAAFPLDDENIHSVCAHVRFGSLGISQAKDFILEALEKAMLLTKQNLIPSVVGFDPLNRDELGGNAAAVHELLSVIKRIGWSDNETEGAVRVEIIPGDSETEGAVRVDGLPLMPVADDSLPHGSGCGHTNYGLRAIEAESSNTDSTISRNGKLNKEFIAETDKRFKRAADCGLNWKVIPYSVRTFYPEGLPVPIAAQK